MRNRLLRCLFIFTLAVVPVVGQTDDGAPVIVLESQWSRTRLPRAVVDASRAAPVAGMIPENKKLVRDARAQQSPGALDPNELTVDGRSAAIEKMVQQSRTGKAEPVNGYKYLAKIQNLTKFVIEVVFLEFHFSELADPSKTVRRQFLCAVKIRPGNTRWLEGFSHLGPSEVISAKNLTKGSESRIENRVEINRVEFDNGTLSQRNDWNYAEVSAAIKRAADAPWGTEMCRGF
ncbi:MAG: hypothetical protein WBD22_01340 [Pyrinomonadaceae bacterium]